LVRLRRHRTETETVLEHVAMTDAEIGEIVSTLERHGDALLADLSASRFDVVGKVPVNKDVVGRLREALGRLPRPIEIADRPNAGG
jgi:hypothetical protein